MDLLQEHLVRARAAGGVFARSAANPPWGLRLSGIQLAVHAVIQGQIWLWTEAGEEALALRPGDLAFVRGRPDHFVAHEPGATCVSPDEFRRLHTAGEVELGAQGAVFCGAYQFAGDIGAGLTPMQYLSDWRMTLARDLLLTDGLSLSQIAERVGYSSQYAFATAFRRHHGEPPGRWRHHHALNPPAVLAAH